MAAIPLLPVLLRESKNSLSIRALRHIKRRFTKAETK